MACLRHNARQSAESGGTIHLEINFTPKVYSTGCMTPLVIPYNVYIVQLQTKDQLMSTIGISFCNYQVAGEDPNCTICSCKQRISITHN